MNGAFQECPRTLKKIKKRFLTQFTSVKEKPEECDPPFELNRHDGNLDDARVDCFNLESND